MSKFSNLQCAFITILFCSSLRCLAQDPASVTLQFLSFPKSNAPVAIEFLVGENKTIKLEVPTNELSPPQTIKLQTKWIFGETVEGKDGKPAFNVLGQAQALSSTKQLILLVRKGATNADGFDVIPVDYQDSKFGGGKFLFMNAATIDIAGTIGDVQFVIKPGQHTIVAPKKETRNEDKKLCNIQIFFKKGEEAKNFFSSTWPVEANARSLIFFYHDSDNKRLRLHTIQDFPQ